MTIIENDLITWNKYMYKHSSSYQSHRTWTCTHSSYKAHTASCQRKWQPQEKHSSYKALPTTAHICFQEISLSEKVLRVHDLHYPHTYYMYNYLIVHAQCIWMFACRIWNLYQQVAFRYNICFAFQSQCEVSSTACVLDIVQDLE